MFCRFFNSRSGCGRGKSCHFSHRLVRKLEDEKDGDIEKEREVTLNDEEKECDSDELRKGRLGEIKFGWMPRGMGKHVFESEIFPIKDEPQESDAEEIEEEKDLYDELIEAMNEGNDQLTDEMMDIILDRFEIRDQHIIEYREYIMLKTQNRGYFRVSWFVHVQRQE